MEEFYNIEEIEKYLEGSLEGTELENFNRRLKSDSDLVKKVELIKKVDHSIRDEKALDLQLKLTALGDEFFGNESKENSTTYKDEKSVSLFRRPVVGLMSIFILLLIGGLIWWLFIKNPLSGPQLYEKYYSEHIEYDDSRGDNSEYLMGIQLYKKQEYSKAIIAFQNYLDSIPNDMKTIYCLGHAHLNTKPPQFDQAGIMFQDIIEDGRSIFVTNAKWYLALIELRQENWTEVKKLLMEISSSEDPLLAEPAQEILKKID